MTSASTKLSDEDFLKIAVRELLLTPGEAKKVSKAAEESAISLPALCVEQGILRPVQVDVIHGLGESGDLAPGYKVIDLLGYGGLGIVYRVEQPKLDRKVALKTIPIHRIEDPAVLARFKQEAVAVGKLKHPNIVAAYDFGTHNDRVYLAMELVEGTDLDKLIKKSGSLDESTAWALAQQAAAGLAHAAQHNLVHRDIKPGNLLLTKPLAGYPLPPGVPHLKITDFGLVQLERPDSDGTRLTMGGTSLGTPHYMAPEQIADAHVDGSADIYALGATVFHMLVGEPPFTGKKMSQVLAAKLKGDLTWVENLPEGTSQGTVELLKAMLAQDPADRISNYETLLARIKGVQQQVSDDLGNAETIVNLISDPSLDLMLMTPPGTVVRRRKRSLLWLGGVFGVLLLGLVSFLIYGLANYDKVLTDKPRLMPSGWDQYLFNGRDVTNWTAHRGPWGTDRDTMGSPVMAGKGSIVHTVPKRDAEAEGPLPYYGLRLNIDLHEAEEAEIHFEHQDVWDDDSPRNVLRMTHSGIVLGSKASKRADFEAETRLNPLPTDSASHYHELRLERHMGHWRALLNGKHVASKRIDEDRSAEAIQLVVGGGQAWFADLAIYEMVEKR